jgi:ATP-binding cassette, subfamily B, bacterial
MEQKQTTALKPKNAFYLKRVLGIIWRSVPGWSFAGVALIFVQGAIPLLSLYFMKRAIDAITHAISAADKSQAFGQAALYIGLMAGMAFFNILCNLASSLINETQSQTITDYIYDLLHAKSVAVDLEYYENPEYFDTLHRAQREAPYKPTHIVNSFVRIGQSAVSLAAITILLFSLNWVIALILFLAAVPGLLIRLLYSDKTYRLQRGQTPADRKSWYYHLLLTGEAYAKEVRLFNLGSMFIGLFRDLRLRLRRERLSFTKKRQLIDLIGQASTLLAVFGSFAFIAHRTILEAITLGSLVMYYQAFQRGQSALSEMLGGLAGLYEDNLFLAYLYEFLDLSPKIAEPLHPRPIPRPLRKGIVFDRINFHYPTGTNNVLEDVSFEIRPGQAVALVGENGSGKTTLIKLLCRLYDPVSGTITLDGVDLREFETKAIRKEISVIFQDYVQYHTTAEENIWYGDIAAPPDRARIMAAARYSGAHEVIERLPKGYDTPLGKWFENGEELSAGEWQKIALARAFLRNTQLIVLDEPTSSLDARAEYEVFSKFRKLVEGKSAILISHRFSTVRMADYIYVLDGGRIVENGTHNDLVKSGGMYAKLFEMQAQSYR